VRVQRAPLAADQPQPPPASHQPATFSAGVDLDLTRVVARLTRARLVAEVAVLLVAACRAEGLIDDGSPLCVARPSGGGLVGVRLDRAARQSAADVSAAVESPGVELSTPAATALILVDLDATGIRAAGDWGLGGAGVATLGRAVPTVVSRPHTDGSGLGLAQRFLAPFDLAVPGTRGQACAAVRAVAALARSVGRMGR
jgi:hypothetical protein